MKRKHNDQTVKYFGHIEWHNTKMIAVLKLKGKQQEDYDNIIG